MEQKAFSNVNLIEDENMTEIGRNIAKKCKGLPLAAKTLGSVLYSKSSEQDWNSILESVFWDLPEDQNEIFTSLARSYHHLPAHLKKCFAYCSIFPRNYHFIMDDLVLLWMAEGFLLPRGQIRLEDIGNEYFMDLARRSFFHVLDVDGISKKIYVMHELIHDLAHLVSSNTCFPLEITYPESVTKLRGLQTLNLNACTSFFELPVNLKNLTNLRHLDLDVKHQLCRMPSHLGSLTKLQTLSAFIAGNEEGQSKSELKNMQLLRGSICITNLDKVSSATEARGARLDEKPYIDKLVLEWEHTQTTGNISKEFVQNLKPHKNVKNLVGIIELQNCQNCKNIPSLGFLRFLKSLYIVCMPNLVSIGQEFCGNANVTAFPVLETLILEDMQKLNEWKELDVNGMPNLRELTIMDCPSLISLPRLFALNSLHSLSVAQCQNLESLPDGGLPESLGSLIILHCPKIKRRCRVRDGEDWEKIQNVRKIEIDYQCISTTCFICPIFASDCYLISANLNNFV
ncbi:antimicrobial response protein [Lithospermum erythrorhizon]|uniref:Antimicrobial response protein n=1 Tax=Lithospermum erythrorhizon TaxID=34254 RepID=A0AAV3PE83_LITER